MADDPHPSPDLPRPPPLPSWSELLASLSPAARRRAIVAAASMLAIAAGLLAVHLLVRAPAPPTESLLPYAGAAPAGTGPAEPTDPAVGPTSSTAPSELVVHAAGAVAGPGVHHLPAGSRVADLLAAAGGATPDADLDRVNLAAPLVDGGQVWFPRVGEVPPAAVGGAASAAPAGEAGPVNLNTASVDELLDVPGIGDAKLAQLRDLVSV